MSETDENWQISLNDTEALQATVNEQISTTLKECSTRILRVFT
jgi:hypothetical protein